ncbi:MAG: hypothetical protein IJI65_00850 [Lachnospiraceae bacterium]|nr:hypothetical protein [Lachnospiraceae bacterium]
MKKKPLIILVLVVVAIVVFYVLIQKGVIKLESYSDTEKEKEITSIKAIPLLESNKVYVYHGSSLEKDAEGYDQTEGDFIECGYSTINFEVSDSYRKSNADKTRVVWVSESDERKVPTLDANNGDKLVYSYLSTREILPISLERYYNNGYTIGVSNLKPDDGGHIILSVSSKEKDAKSYVNIQSDAMQVNELAQQFEDGVIYLDAIGGKKLSGDNLTAGGAVQGLEKGGSYVCNFYTGTYFQDFVLTSDHVCYSGFPDEFFNLYRYNFLHSNIIEIEIPDFFKSGYYFVNGLGMIRYIAKGDTADSPTDTPNVEKDEDGNILNPEIFSYGKLNTSSSSGAKEITTPSAKETVEGAASTEPIRRYTYTNGEGRKALITVNISGSPVNGTPAQIAVTDPNGKTTTIDENNGSAAYQGEAAGLYQIIVSNVAGRDVSLVTE